MEVFTFNPISLDDVVKYAEDCKVFNSLKEDIEKEKIMLASFSDEKLGSSMEKLDLAVFSNGEWKILDIDKKIEGYNEIPLGYLISSVNYDKVMVILRRMSTMVLDKVKEGISTYIYNAIPEKYRSLNGNASMIGMLAKNRISLDDSDEMYKRIEESGDCDVIKKWLSNIEKEVNNNE